MAKFVSAAFVAVVCLFFGAGTDAADPEGKGAPGMSLGVVPLGDHGPKKKFPLYVAIRNHGPKLLRVLPNKVPLIWGFFYDPVERPAKSDGFARGKEEQIRDLHSVVIVQSETMQEGDEVCLGSGPLVVAVAADNEVLIETTVDFGLLDDGTFDLDLNLAALTLSEGKRCAITKYGRGKARITVEVKGDEMRLVRRAGLRRLEGSR
jgi:hypothetical protein